MKKRISFCALIAFIALGTLMHAQEAKQETKQAAAPEEKGGVTKIFQVKHQDVANLVELLQAFGATIRYSDRLHTIAVSARPEIVQAISDAIQRLDVPAPPPKNVELIFYILAALPQPSQSGSLPQDLEPVTKQLKGVFPYQSFKVLDTMILRCRDGQGGEASGAGPPISGPTDSGQRAIYQIAFRTLSVTSDGKERVVRFDRLKLGARVPVQAGPSWQYVDTGFSTDIDVREGQKVVIGKANIDAANNAMIAVVTAKVVD